MRTVIRKKVGNEVFRLANISWAQGFAIQVLRGKSYRTIHHLGWHDEKDARVIFEDFCKVI